MVPMRMNFYRYREEVKRAILQRVARLNSAWDPFGVSWLAYALSQDGFEENQPLLELVRRLSRWAENDEAWAARRNLGALCFLGYFLSKMSKDAPDFTDRVLEQIERLEEQKSHKFSPVNDPEQVFPMALLVGFLEEASQSLKDFLKEVARTRIQGAIKRRILYCAALRELGENPSISIEDVSDPSDVIALVWYWERYAPSGEQAKLWKAFENIKDGLSFDRDEVREGVRVLSDSEVALLYEALTRETAEPDPNLLFEFYLLHPRVKDIARKHFENGNYLTAVFEAAKAFEKYLKELTGIEQTCRPLVQQSMGGNSPRIKFNNCRTKSEKNEQEGLKLIAEGICAAFRNPKGHEPEDSPQVQIDALEALDQLVIISYIFKRVERAQAKLGSEETL
ncbi:TIGR02391 family protein [Rhodothermus marinus]|uniref:TIGR02391 family protein n=2 Tax=Rhodothermus marinus TaxID=29549 RepID=UPI0012BA3E55|nr:TIGR02391 family protein [Rhodothermus marinus]BBM69292.1 hypothetical protein RmaAA213_11380 [Rhodothermus marinus]BBM72284.1 hypothetical protein RmaAA338_11490 [Rhodothermus marinus]